MGLSVTGRRSEVGPIERRGRHRRPRPLVLVTLAAVVLAGLGALAVGPATGSAAVTPGARRTCEQFGSLGVSGDTYVIQNARWGARTEQCISESGPTGFVVDSARHVNTTGPAGYPSIYRGCTYGYCTAGSPFPALVATLGSLRSSWATTGPTAGGVQQYNTAYDIWFDPARSQPGRPTGAELMIWLNRTSWVQPIGRPYYDVSVAGTTWTVWYGKADPPVISYVRKTPTTSVTNLPVDAFVRDAMIRGVVRPTWWLQSVQAGFEPWTGGTGLATTSFSVTRNGR